MSDIVAVLLDVQPLFRPFEVAVQRGCWRERSKHAALFRAVRLIRRQIYASLEDSKQRLDVKKGRFNFAHRR